MWVSTSWTVISRSASRETWFTSLPLSKTRRSANEGRKRETGFSSRTLPSSYSIIRATLVTGFVIE